MLGYNVDNDVLSLIGDPSIIQIALKGLLFILVLHPICAVFNFLSLVFVVFSRQHCMAIFALVLAIVTAILSTLAAVIDIALVAVAKNKVGSITEFSFTVGWGNAPWMTLVSAIFLWVVVVLYSILLCGCCGVSRQLWVRYVLSVFLIVNYVFDWFIAMTKRRKAPAINTKTSMIDQRPS